MHMKICGKCGAELKDKARFCTQCGAPWEAPEEPEDLRGSLESVLEQLDREEEAIRKLREEVTRMMASAGDGRFARDDRPVPDDRPAWEKPPAWKNPKPFFAGKSSSGLGGEASPEKNLEFHVGANILSVIGALFVILSFLIFGSTMLTGGLQGAFIFLIFILLLTFSELFVRKKLPAFSAVLSGIGIAGLYASVVINHFFLHTMGEPVTLLLTGLVSAFAIFLGGKRESLTMRLIVLLGCFVVIGLLEDPETKHTYYLIAGLYFLVNAGLAFRPPASSPELFGILQILIASGFYLALMGYAEAKDLFLGGMPGKGVFGIPMMFLLLIYEEIRLVTENRGVRAFLPVTRALAAAFMLAAVRIWMASEGGPIAESFFWTAALSLPFAGGCAAAMLLLKRKKSELFRLFYILALFWPLSIAYQDEGAPGILTAVCAFILSLGVRYFLPGGDADPAEETGDGREISGWRGTSGFRDLLRFLGKMNLVYADLFPLLSGAVLLLITLVHEEPWPSLLALFVLGAGMFLAAGARPLYGFLALAALAGDLARFSEDYHLKDEWGAFAALCGAALLMGAVRILPKEQREKTIFADIFTITALLFAAFCHLVFLDSENTAAYLAFLALGTACIFLFIPALKLCGGRTDAAYVPFAGYLTYMILVSDAPVPVLISIGLLTLAVVCVLGGFKLRVKPVRIYGLGVAIFACVKIAVHDFSGLNNRERILVFLLAGVLALAISFIYLRLEKQESMNERKNRDE